MKKDSTWPSSPNEMDRVFQALVLEAQKYRGATAPNPPVGACALDDQGNILSLFAHVRAGTSHAEARVLEDCRQRNLEPAHLVVTLEPCNHQGRTPPCTDAIMRTQIQNIWIGCSDPHNLARGGAERLRANSKTVQVLNRKDCLDLIESFAWVLKTGLPYVTVKIALDEKDSMIPPQGSKTFTHSLKLSHELRKRADAILTGSQTILTDQPLFTVREVVDHPKKVRDLVILDRRKRVLQEYLNACKSNGLEVFIENDLEEALKKIAARGGLEVLVEAGPTITQRVLDSGLWNEKVQIKKQPNGPDQVLIQLNSGAK